MKVMRAKRIPLPQAPTVDILRDKLKEVDERLYAANMECGSVANARRPKRARQASSVDDANVRCEMTCHSNGIQVQLITDEKNAKCARKQGQVQSSMKNRIFKFAAKFQRASHPGDVGTFAQTL